LTGAPSRAYLDRARDPEPLLHRVEGAFAYDAAALRAFFEEHAAPLAPGLAVPGAHVGSWALLSSDARHDGGTEQGQHAYSAGEDGLVHRDAGFARPTYRTPTNLCFGHARELLERLERELFVPARARFLRIPPGHRYRWHRDAATETWRLHFPVITNPRARFQWRPWGPEERVVSLPMPAGEHPFWVRTDVEHRFANDGEEARVHLVVNVARGSSARLPWAPAD
jgi:hypothetical protein